jgi:RNA polymerase sigma-70 factor (ECF subfamily)
MDDANVIARFRKTGDRAMFAVLVERYQDRVFRLAASILGPYSEADAEEVAQEVFLRVYRKLDQYTGEAAFGTWLYRIAYNLALDRRRTARFRIPHVSLETIGESAGPSDPPGEIIARERQRRVAKAMEKLPDLYRSSLYMHYWMGMSIEEIADSLGAPEGTVKSYLFRARRMLKGALAGERESSRTGRT